MQFVCKRQDVQRRSGRAGFANDIAGNVAMIFTLALLPIFMVVGFAVDNGRHITYQQKLQTSLDLAALATARQLMNDPSMTDAQVDAAAQAFFEAQFNYAEGITLQPVQATETTNEVVLSATGTLDTTMMAIIGRETMPLGAETTVVIDVRKPVELALVLDTSGSMSGSKLTTLQTAAKSMVTMLLPSNVATENTAAKIAVVPFARYVNVGTDKRFESWIDVEPSRTDTRERCNTTITREARLDAGCRRESYSCTRWRGSIEQGNREQYQTTCYRWDCPPGAEPESTTTCNTVTTEYRWYGCVKSRPSPLNIEDRDYTTDPVDGFVTTNGNLCPAQIQELTNSQRDVNIAIDALNARNDTYIPTGLVWGLRALSPGGPFDEGEDYTSFANKDGRKVLVLMSDGANTRSPNNSGLHNRTDVTAANTTMTAVCDEIKANNIEIYTIAFEIDDTATKDLIKGCATTEDAYYDAANAEQLAAAFAEIGSDLRELAIAS